MVDRVFYSRFIVASIDLSRSDLGQKGSIDAQISRLRKKIEMDPKRPKLIKSVHGDGYVFTATVSKFVAARN